MKLQLGILVVIAVLSAYIYYTKDGEGGGEQLLGFSSSIKAHREKAQKNLDDAKEAWKKVYGSKNLPVKDSTLLLWHIYLKQWQEVYRTKGYPSSDKVDLFKWKIDYDKKKKAAEEKAKKDRASREAKAKKDKAAREEAARKAKDVCEWVKLRKK